MIENDKKYYSIKQLSLILKLHPQTIRKYVRDGNLKAFQFGRTYRVSDEQLGEFLNKRKTE